MKNMKNNWTRNIKYFIIAIIILILGYFFGIIILGIIAIIILLMSILFVISLIFHKSVDLFLNKKIKLFIKMFFSLVVSYGFILIFWNFINKVKSTNIKIMLIWAITSFIFGSLWNILVIKKKVSYKNKVFDYIEEKSGLNIRDILFMIIIPVIFTIFLSILKGFIII